MGVSALGFRVSGGRTFTWTATADGLLPVEHMKFGDAARGDREAIERGTRGVRTDTAQHVGLRPAPE